jgi:hypothetical protein
MPEDNNYCCISHRTAESRKNVGGNEGKFNFMLGFFIIIVLYNICEIFLTRILYNFATDIVCYKTSNNSE